MKVYYYFNKSINHWILFIKHTNGYWGRLNKIKVYKIKFTLWKCLISLLFLCIDAKIFAFSQHRVYMLNLWVFFFRHHLWNLKPAQNRLSSGFFFSYDVHKRFFNSVKGTKKYVNCSSNVYFLKNMINGELSALESSTFNLVLSHLELNI